MKSLKSSLFFILIGFLFLEIFLGFPIQLEKYEKEISHEPEMLIDKKMSGVHLVESRQGKRDWELFAEKAEGHDLKNNWQLQTVKAIFYSDNLIAFTVTGERGEIDTLNKDIVIEGKVLMTSSNGYRFQTDVVHYRAQKRMLVSPQFVTVIGPKDQHGSELTLNGKKMEAFVDHGLMRILNNVIAKKSLSDSKKLNVTSERAEMSTKASSFKFIQDVIIKLGSMRLEGPEADFRYHNKRLQDLQMRGGVKVTDVNRRATSQDLSFEPSENKFILKGSPRLSQEDDEVSGDEIILFDGGKKVKVSNMKAHLEKELK